METAILDVLQIGGKNGASACVHLLNVLYCPKLHSCQRKHLYYKVQLLGGILCALAHPLKDSATSSPILKEDDTSVRLSFQIELQSAVACRRVERRDCAHEALPRLQSVSSWLVME